MQQNSSNREVHNDKCLYIRNKTQPNFTTQGIRKEEQIKAKVSSRKLYKRDHSRHKWNRDWKDSGKDQWNQELFCWKTVAGLSERKKEEELNK